MDFKASANGMRRWRLAPGALRRSVRANIFLVVTVLAVMSALGVVVALVSVRAAQKDGLRQAQIALAGSPTALESVLTSPRAMLESKHVTESEFPLSTALRARLASSVVGLDRYWHAPLARTLLARGELINARTVKLMGLIAAHSFAAANALENRYIVPIAAPTEAEIAMAKRQLDLQTESSGRTAREETLITVGVVGALLVLLLVGVGYTRRRLLRNEIERSALSESERRLQVLVENGSDMIVVVAPDTTVLYQAGAVEAMLGYDPRELEAAKLTGWVDPEDRASLLALCAAGGRASEELRLCHRDGTQRTCEVHATSVLEDPAWKGIVLNIWDLSDRKALEERLRHQALHDGLTGLPNRTLALDRAEQMLARARRSSLPAAALYLDLDGFKEVNDRFGHAAGDELLRLVAGRLGSIVRDGDTAARLAGDEFVVLLEGSATDAGPELVAERLLEMLRRPYEMKGQIGRDLVVTPSVGVAVGGEGSAEELLRDADVALYEAKGAGGNRYVVFESSMQMAAHDRLTLEMDLAEALDRNELYLVYQPTFDLQSQRAIGVEALIRWRHPTRGIVEPGQFIPIAERSELIVPIGRWVLEEACRQAAAWHADGYQLGMSVNVSAVQLDRDELIDNVRDSLERSGLGPSFLTLEITETTLMRDADGTAKRLLALKQLGVRIAIDDFGTGYSSLAYLRKFPVDAMKIDRSFISGIASTSGSTALISTLVQLGKTLNIETLAEGIEEPAQLRALLREHCDHGQGFLFARPLEAEEIESFLQAAGQADLPSLVGG